MMQWIKDKLEYFWSTIHGSETILWARIQVIGGVVLGILATVLQTIDPNMLGLDAKYVMLWTVANGLLSEYLRRRSAQYEDNGDIK